MECCASRRSLDNSESSFGHAPPIERSLALQNGAGPLATAERNSAEGRYVARGEDQAFQANQMPSGAQADFDSRLKQLEMRVNEVQDASEKHMKDLASSVSSLREQVQNSQQQISSQTAPSSSNCKDELLPSGEAPDDLGKQVASLLSLKKEFGEFRQQLLQEFADSVCKFELMQKETIKKSEEQIASCSRDVKDEWKQDNVQEEIKSPTKLFSEFLPLEGKVDEQPILEMEKVKLSLEAKDGEHVAEQPSPEAQGYCSATYTLEESVLDASLLLWIENLGFGCSVFGFVLLTINMLVQGVFCITVATTLTSSSFNDDSSSSYRLWRANVAHDYKYITVLSGQSLATRVCAGDPGLELSQGQADAHDALARYLEGHQFFFIESGAIVLVLCLFVWCMMIITELDGTINATLAIFPLCGRATQITVSECGEKYILATVGPIRTAWFLLVQVCRFTFAIVLACCGVAYLTYTIDIGDIMLNTLALEFVLNLDEMIFTTFTPVHFKDLLGSIEDLSLPQIRQIAKVDLISVAKVMLALLSLGLVIPLFVAPQLGILWDNKDALCGGQIDFVYTKSEFGLAFWSPSNPHDDAPDHRPWRWPDEELRKENQATQLLHTVMSDAGTCESQLAQESYDCGTCGNSAPFTCGNHNLTSWGIPTCCWTVNQQLPSLAAGAFSTKSVAEMSVDETVLQYNPFCFDFIGWEWFATYMYASAFADAIPDQAEDCGGCPDRYRPYCRNGECVTPTCGEDVVQFCREESEAGVRARMYCPWTCECHLPRSLQILTAPGYGCGPACTEQAYFDDALAAIPCQDLPPGDTALVNYATEWERIARGWPQGKQDIAVSFADKLRREGCTNYSKWVFGYFNVPFVGTDAQLFYSCGGYHPTTGEYAGPGTMPIKPLGYFCPATCRCRKGVFGCPSTCPV